MTQEQVSLALFELFNKRDKVEQKRQLVFWYDPKREFEDVFEALPVGGEIEKIKLNGTPFRVKYQLLIEQPDTSFLVYAPFEKPAPQDNWLLDLEKQALPFEADRAEVIARQYGFRNRALTVYLREHLSFFNSKKRLEAFNAMDVSEDSSEMDVRLTMMCVVAGLRTAEATPFFRALLLQGLREDTNPLWQELMKFFSPQEVWALAEQHLGFRAAYPTLRELFLRLAVTHMNHDITESLPIGLLSKFIRPHNKAYGFVDSWLKHREDSDIWATMTAQYADDWGIPQWVETLDPESYRDAQTFEAFDKALIRTVVRQLVAGEANYAGIAEWISSRKPLYWFGKYEAYYAALEAASGFFEGLSRLEESLDNDATSLFRNYAQSYYRLDQQYRHYVAASDETSSDVLYALTEKVHKAYSNGYLQKLNEVWTWAITESNDAWLIPGLYKQWDFYNENVKPILAKNDREKVFVIISDALRYEVADELRNTLVKDLRGEATLIPLLSVLPSITMMGMAALLPGENLTLEENGTVFKDGLSTQGSDNRSLLLNKTGVSSTVIKADDLLAMPRDDGRQAVQPHRVIYIYQDKIDAAGDKAASEHTVFAACKTAIEDLHALVKKIANALNGTHILITSDHGFLYERHNLAEHNKVKQPRGNLLDSGRRHVVGRDLEDAEGTMEFSLPFIATEQLKARVPKGTLRYALQGGGAQYVHGGASLQEVCVPLISYKHVRAVKGDEGPSHKVGVQMNATSRKVTNNHFTVRLVQSEPIGERLRPRTLSVKFVDAQGKKVTSESTLLLDSLATQATDREFNARLSVTITNPERTQNYYLVVTDTEDDLELLREAWQINLAFTDDFGDL
jgi:uncharacterized protein (TIGR02687 family)